MRIPEEKIEEIRDSADIVDIISGYIQLKKRGKNYIGLCPFHQEKTPSFTVSGEKQIFHCFGCGAGGNVFKFLMDFKSISFVEAVQEVADNLGIKIEPAAGSVQEQQDEVEELYEINVLAAKFFSNNLLKGDSAIPSQYLEKRNIKTNTQRIFGLGYAPTGWDNFLKYALEKKIDLDKAVILGLLDRKESGEYYDKFRERIIFPIFSPNGRVIAFGGRTLSDRKDVAKYLNSPESVVYLKRKSLYGLYHSKEEIRSLDKAILVEGYTDLISLFQNGIKNVVASSGTSLTDEQVRLLSRYTKNIIVLFDADTAGQKAGLRSVEILLKQDFEVKFLTLPPGEDPDSFINKNSKTDFEELIARSVNFLEFQIQQFEKEGALQDPAVQTKAVRELVKSAALVNDELKRNLYIKSIARKFNLREKLIETELNKYLKQKISTETRKIRDKKVEVGTPDSNKPETSKLLVPIEKLFIKLLFENEEEITEEIFETISPDEFSDPMHKRIARIVYDAHKEDIYNPAALLERTKDDDLRQYIFGLTIKEETISHRIWKDFITEEKLKNDLRKFARDTIRTYRIKRYDEEIKTISKKLSNAASEIEEMNLLKKSKEIQEKRSLLVNDNNKQ